MNEVKEKEMKGLNGWIMLAVVIVGFLGGVAGAIAGAVITEGAGFIPGAILMLIAIICIPGFKVLAPNEALVFTLFGKYHGTLKKDGFYFVNPFCTSVNPAAAFGKGGRKLSLKKMT